MDLTSEYFQSSKLTIYQPKKGHRYGVESLVLADFCNIDGSDRVVEFCSGIGIISLIISRKYRPSQIVAVEIQPELQEISSKNISENKANVESVCMDYREYAQSHPESYDCVVANPPFYAVGRGRISANEQRAIARHELNGTLDDLIVSANMVLKKIGRLFIVYPEQRRNELIDKASSFFRLMREDDSHDDVILCEFHHV